MRCSALLLRCVLRLTILSRLSACSCKRHEAFQAAAALVAAAEEEQREAEEEEAIEVHEEEDGDVLSCHGGSLCLVPIHSLVAMLSCNSVWSASRPL